MSGSNPGLVALSDHGLSIVHLQGPNTEGVPIGMPRGNGWHCGPTFIGTPLCPRHFQQKGAGQSFVYESFFTFEKYTKKRVSQPLGV